MRALTLGCRALACAGGENALRIAIKEGREDLVELLADFRANLGHDAEGRTALHWAGELGATAGVVLRLLKVGAHLEATTKVIRKNGFRTFAQWLVHRVHVHVTHAHTYIDLLQAAERSGCGLQRVCCASLCTYAALRYARMPYVHSCMISMIYIYTSRTAKQP